MRDFSKDKQNKDVKIQKEVYLTTYYTTSQANKFHDPRGSLTTWNILWKIHWQQSQVAFHILRRMLCPTHQAPVKHPASLPFSKGSGCLLKSDMASVSTHQYQPSCVINFISSHMFGHWKGPQVQENSDQCSSFSYVELYTVKRMQNSNSVSWVRFLNIWPSKIRHSNISILPVFAAGAFQAHIYLSFLF